MYGDALPVAPILTYNAKTETGKRVLDYGSDVTRNVYLPEGTWIDLRTGEKIVVGENGEDLSVTVPFGEIPVYLNANSVYAAALGDVFNGKTWKAIMNNDALLIPVGSAATDAFGKDIFDDLMKKSHA
jgi:alpha-glucosidase (family GH31 glycosyl hydrolase)